MTMLPAINFLSKSNLSANANGVMASGIDAAIIDVEKLKSKFT